MSECMQAWLRSACLFVCVCVCISIMYTVRIINCLPSNTNNMTLHQICRKDDVVYEELYTESIEHPEIFWKKMAFKLLQWTTPFETTNSSDIKMGTIQWFRGGQLNVSGNYHHCINVQWYVV